MAELERAPRRSSHDEWLLSLAGPPGSKERLHAEAVCDAHRLLEGVELRGSLRRICLEDGCSEAETEEILSRLFA